MSSTRRAGTGGTPESRESGLSRASASSGYMSSPFYNAVLRPREIK